MSDEPDVWMAEFEYPNMESSVTVHVGESAPTVEIVKAAFCSGDYFAQITDVKTGSVFYLPTEPKPVIRCYKKS